MPSYLQIENISKSYGPKVLFEHIGFNINEGDKIALIAPNGTGKTSLLRILAGTDSSDSGGKIIFLKDIRIAFLEQEYAYDPEATVWEQIISDSRKWTKDLDPEHVAEYELRIRQLLTSFGMSDWDRQMKTLSGGEINCRDACQRGGLLHHGRADEPSGHRCDRVPRELSFPCPLHPADGDP